MTCRQQKNWAEIDKHKRTTFLFYFFIFLKWKVSVVQLWRHSSNVFLQQLSRKCKEKKVAKLEQRSILSGIISVYLCWIWAMLTVLGFLLRVFTAYTRLYVLCLRQGFLAASVILKVIGEWCSFIFFKNPLKFIYFFLKIDIFHLCFVEWNQIGSYMLLEAQQGCLPLWVMLLASQTQQFKHSGHSG